MSATLIGIDVGGTNFRLGVVQGARGLGKVFPGRLRRIVSQDVRSGGADSDPVH